MTQIGSTYEITVRRTSAQSWATIDETIAVEMAEDFADFINAGLLLNHRYPPGDSIDVQVVPVSFSVAD